MQAKGVDGEVRFGYHCAASIKDWTLVEAVDRSWRLDCTVKEKNDYYLQQTPLTVLLHVGSKRWLWKVGRMNINKTRATFFFDGDPTK